MSKIEDFAHGYHYGDYSGVIFYGPFERSGTLNELAISDCYIAPLFRSIIDRAWRASDGDEVPRLVSEWCTLKGWADLGIGPTPVSSKDAAEFVAALAQLGPDDLAENCSGCTIEECLSCAAVICEFINSRLAREVSISIKDD